jgi:hypothetical protein
VLTVDNPRIAEVIETGTSEFKAECYELHALPPLGSLVKTMGGQTGIYAIVYNASTSSIEPGRRPIARGKGEPDEEAVYRSNPQLSRLLRSEFSSLVVGFSEDDVVLQRLPPTPARIHSFVYMCSDEEVRVFSRSLDFLTVLLSARVQASLEEVTAAALRQFSRAHEEPRQFLISAGKETSVLLGSDYARLRAILARLGPK